MTNKTNKLSFKELSSTRKAGFVFLCILAALFIVALFINIPSSDKSLVSGDLFIILIIAWGINKIQYPKQKDIFPKNK